MKKFTGFERGMGIGGWLTNYKRFNVLPDHMRTKLTIGDLEHFQTYITENDVAYIKSLGMDHIRLGFDQLVLEEKPGCYREEIFELIDRFIGWCRKYDLNVVLNLHKAIGNYCDIQEEVELLDSEELQQRFVDLWIAFEKRYTSFPEVAFEILNEVRDVAPVKWNTLAKRTLDAIRALNAERKIIIGPTCWNNLEKLDQMQVYDDENVIYTFHMYEPFEFTHQRGVLQMHPCYYNRDMPYPGDIERYRDYCRELFDAKAPYAEFEKMDIQFIRQSMKRAGAFIEKHPDKILWCGEFGTIRHANIKWRENWMRDIITVLKEYEIPYSVWNYLSTPNDGNRFSLVDDDQRKILSEEMARIIRGEV